MHWQKLLGRWHDTHALTNSSDTDTLTRTVKHTDKRPRLWMRTARRRRQLAKRECQAVERRERGDRREEWREGKAEGSAMILWVLLAFQRFSVFLLNILEMFRNPMIVQWHVRASSLQLALSPLPFSPLPFPSSYSSSHCLRLLLLLRHFSLSNRAARGTAKCCLSF